MWRDRREARKLRVMILLAFLMSYTIDTALSQTAASSVTGGIAQTSDADIVHTTCGENVEIRPVPEPFTDNSTRVMVTYDNIPTVSANCSWIIRPLDNSSSNFFLAVNRTPTFHREGCEFNTLSFYDLDEASGNLSFITDGCSELTLVQGAAMGRIGYPTVIKYMARNVTQKQQLLFMYGTKTWSETECPQNSLQLTATVERQTVTVPKDFLRLPNELSCNWEIRGPDKGVFNMEVMSHLANATNGPPSSCDSDDMFYVMDAGGPTSMQKPAYVKLCEEGTLFQHRSYSGTIILAFHSGDTSGGPVFYIRYWAEDMNFLCPPKFSIDGSLWASLGKMEVFKGVSQEIGNATERDCWWQIGTVEKDAVVKLVKIYNMDYLSDCHSRDKLTIGRDKTIGMCENDAFPIWSETQVINLHFHTDFSSPRREFFIYYTAVKRGECQGHPVSLVATTEPQTLTESALPSDNSSDGTDCRWLIKAEKSDDTLQIKVNSTNNTSSCYLLRVSVYDGGQLDLDHLLPASCQPNATIRTYTSRSDKVLIVFNRDPEKLVGQVVDDFEMSFVALRNDVDTGGSAGLGLHPLLAVCVLLCLYRVFF